MTAHQPESYRLAYPPRDAAAMLGVSVSQLNEWRHRGWIKRIKLNPAAKNSTTLYAHDDLVALIERLKVESEAAAS